MLCIFYFIVFSYYQLSILYSAEDTALLDVLLLILDFVNQML